MQVEHFSADPETQPRHWVRHDQAFAMMLRPGSIEWGSKRCALEKFDYKASDLALCDRHVGEWVWPNERIASAAGYFRRGTDGLL
jgi:AraC family transcriptional regulator